MAVSTRRPESLLITLPLLVACASDAGPSLCRIPDPEGPVSVVSQASLDSAPRLELRELWRAGGLDEGAALAVPTSLRVARDGTAALPDFGAGAVWLYAPDGEFLGSVGGRGQGPGELLAPIAAAWDAEGQLLILDAGQSKMERYDLSGGTSETLSLPPEFLGPIVASGQVGWFELRGDGTAYLEYPHIPTTPTGASTASLRHLRMAPGEREATVTLETTYPAQQLPAFNLTTRPDWPRALVGVGPIRVAVAPSSDRYELRLLDEDERVTRHLCVEDASPPSPPDPDGEELDEQWIDTAAELSAPSRPALLGRVVVDGDDRIWVERTLPRPGSGWDRIYGAPGGRLDLFSPQGELIARVQMPAGLRFQDAVGDTVWAFTIGDLQEVSIVALQIPR